MQNVQSKLMFVHISFIFVMALFAQYIEHTARFGVTHIMWLNVAWIEQKLVNHGQNELRQFQRLIALFYPEYRNFYVYKLF